MPGSEVIVGVVVTALLAVVPLAVVEACVVCLVTLVVAFSLAAAAAVVVVVISMLVVGIVVPFVVNVVIAAVSVFVVVNVVVAANMFFGNDAFITLRTLPLLSRLIFLVPLTSFLLLAAVDSVPSAVSVCGLPYVRCVFAIVAVLIRHAVVVLIVFHKFTIACV